MGTSASLTATMVMLIVSTCLARGGLCLFKLKRPLSKVLITAIAGAIVFQVANRIYIGFWDPFAIIVFCVSLLVLFVIAGILEIVITYLSPNIKS